MEKGKTTMFQPRPFDTAIDPWDAVRRRDARADGTFVYAVATTGVFCRPTCRSKLPRRENVRFFPTPRDAERDGFRPCRKCRPKDADGESPMKHAVLRACREIESAVAAPSLGELARTAGVTSFHFQRVFKRIVGVSPKQYALAHRLKRFRTELRKNRTVTQAVYGAGFSSSGRAYERVGESLGMNPRDYKEGGRGAIIQFDVFTTRMGPALLAATQKGVCAIAFGNHRDELVRELSNRFPSARLVEKKGERIRRYVAAMRQCLAKNGASMDVPLDILGTAFERRVWLAIRQIPSGETSTYRRIAADIGKPNAVRAVASACAKNPVALAVPCHRVIRSDGGMGGYRWGLNRKKQLLEIEKNRGKTPRESVQASRASS